MSNYHIRHIELPYSSRLMILSSPHSFTSVRLFLSNIVSGYRLIVVTTLFWKQFENLDTRPLRLTIVYRPTGQKRHRFVYTHRTYRAYPGYPGHLYFND